MLALVETFNGETVILPVEGPNPIRQVLAEVEDKGYDVSSVRFFPKSIQIIVQTPIGYPITLLVNRSDTIDSVKSQIQAKEGIPSDQQRLIFGRKKLKDDRGLGSYSISNGSVLEMVSGDGIVDDGEFPSELQDGIICFLSDTKLIGVDAVKMLISKLHSSPTSLPDAPLLFHHDLARRGFPQGMRLLRVNNEIYLSVDPSSEQVFQFNPRNLSGEQFSPEKTCHSEVKEPLKEIDVVDFEGNTYLIASGLADTPYHAFKRRDPSSGQWKVLGEPPLLGHDCLPIEFYCVINDKLFIHRNPDTYYFQSQSGCWQDGSVFMNSVLNFIPPGCFPPGRALGTQFTLPGLAESHTFLVAELLKSIPKPKPMSIPDVDVHANVVSDEDAFVDANLDKFEREGYADDEYDDEYGVILCGIIFDHQQPKQFARSQELKGIFDVDGFPDIRSHRASIFHLGNGVFCAAMVASAVEDTVLVVSRFTLELKQDILKTEADNFLSVIMHQKRIWKFDHSSGPILEAFLC